MKVLWKTKETCKIEKMVITDKFNCVFYKICKTSCNYLYLKLSEMAAQTETKLPGMLIVLTVRTLFSVYFSIAEIAKQANKLLFVFCSIQVLQETPRCDCVPVYSLCLEPQLLSLSLILFFCDRNIKEVFAFCYEALNWVTRHHASDPKNL